MSDIQPSQPELYGFTHPLSTGNAAASGALGLGIALSAAQATCGWEKDPRLAKMCRLPESPLRAKSGHSLPAEFSFVGVPG